MTFLRAWVVLRVWFCFLSTNAVAGRKTAMPAQLCRHLLFWGMSVRERKKKKLCICRYQMVEVEGREVTAVFGCLIGFLSDIEKPGILI